MRLERIIAIIMLLLERDMISGKELSEMFEVSLRTIYRDIKTINQAGIPIITTPGLGGGIGIMRQYKFEKRIFTSADITSMLMGLGFISNTLSSEEITNALAKVKSFIPVEKQEEITLKTSQVAFDLSTWMGNRNLQPKLDLIRSAMENKRMIQFSYMDRSGSQTDRTIEPHRLVLKENYWYVQGYCIIRKDFRTFKLSRLSNLKLLDETYEMREVPQQFIDFFHDMEGKLIKVKLLIESSILDGILDYCSPEDITAVEDGQYLVDFNFINDDYGYGLLMSFGEKCRCLGPKHVKDELVVRIKKMLSQY